MGDVELRGAEDVDALVRRIRLHADAKAIRRELYQGLNRATKPVREDMKASILPSLPSRGGLAALVYAKASITTSAKGGKWAGVSIKARGRKGGGDIARMNRTGRLRHPVFGNRGAWVTQSAGVNPGFLDDAFKNARPDVTRAVSRVLDEIARKVES